ncbi:MAG TPA: hypothetical protein VL025_20920, partial [Thermoanaerobaculia bacterium]|nr:hypothetical protein [Thermoanaerobaculia bacterium]
MIVDGAAEEDRRIVQDRKLHADDCGEPSQDERRRRSGEWIDLDSFRRPSALAGIEEDQAEASKILEGRGQILTADVHARAVRTSEEQYA